MTVLVVVACAACATVPQEGARSGPRPAAVSAAGRGDSAPVATHAGALATVSPGTFGPHLSGHGADQIAVWAEPTPRGLEWVSFSLSTQRRSVIGRTTWRPGLMTVRPLGKVEGTPSGFVLVASASEQPMLTVSIMGASGRSVSKPRSLSTTGERIVWLEALPSSSGTAILWATAHGARATVETAFVARNGEVAVPPHAIVSNALAWQVATMDQGTALAVVREDPTDQRRSVTLSVVDERGTVTSGPTTLYEGTEIGADLDLIADQDGLLFAWTQPASEGEQIVTMTFSPKTGVASRPKPLLSEGDRQRLVQFVAPARGSEHGFIVWRRGAAGDEPVRMSLARLGKDGTVDTERGELPVSGAGAPLVEFVARQGGLAALVQSPLCSAEADCGGQAPFTYVEFDANLRVATREVVEVSQPAGPRVPVDLAWGLDCAAGPCRALAAVANESVVVYHLPLGKSAQGGAPSTRPLADGGSHAEVKRLLQAESVADYEVVDLDGGTLVAWVSDFDPDVPYRRPLEPAPDGKHAPVRALLDVALVNDQGNASEPLRISWRARSVSGIDLAASRDRALLVWSALDNGQPEVFVTLIDGRGKKVSQRMLTHQRAEVYDVAAARVDQGWVVAWIDGRNGNPEVYAARLNERLDLLRPAERITHAPGMATGLDLLSLGPRVLAVWSDDRADPARGVGCIHGVSLRASDAMPNGSDRCLFASDLHAHAPFLTRRGRMGVVAWIEQAPSAGANQAWIRSGELDPDSLWIHPPRRVAFLSGASPAGHAVECSDQERCTVAWLQRSDGGLSLHIGPLDNAGEIRAMHTVASDSSSQRGLRPVFGNDSLYLFHATANIGNRVLERLHLRP